MPQMGVSVAEGTITEWRKRPGDWVERDETIVEISTDKVETEVPSPATGRVGELLVEVGATVDVGTLLATIDTEARAGGGASRRVGRLGRAGGDSRERSAPAPPISPVVRRIADEHHVDLARVEGTRPPRARDQEGHPRLHRGQRRQWPRGAGAAAHRVAVPRGRAGRAAPPVDGRRAALAHAQADRRAHGALAADGRALHHVVEADMSARSRRRAGGCRTCRSWRGRRSPRCASTRGSTPRSRATG